MYPPTPTHLPPGTPFFTIPNSYSLWQSAPYAIQSWNMQPTASQTVIQAIILIALVIAGGFLLTRFLKGMTEGDANE